MLHCVRRTVLVASLLVTAWIFPEKAYPAFPLVLDRNFQGARLDSFIEYYSDDTGSCAIEQLATAEYGSKFRAPRYGQPAFGYTRDCVWLRFSLENTTSAPFRVYMEHEYPLIDSVELYLPAAGGFDVVRRGDRYPFSQRGMDYRNNVFIVSVPPGTHTYYIRMQSSGSISAPLMVWTPENFESMRARELPLLGVFYGIMLALAFYNLFIFLTMREKSYIYLLVFILTFTMVSLVHSGLAFQYLWPGSPAWANSSHPFFSFLTIAFVSLFMCAFLNVRAHSIRLYRAVLIWSHIPLFLAVVSLWADYFYMTQATAVLGGICLLLMIGVGIWGLRKRMREAYFFILAWLSFIVGIALMIFKGFGFLPDVFLTTWGYQVGSSVTMLLFSLGIADKINSYRNERMNALQQLGESEEKYRSLVENAHDGIMLLMGARPVYANPSLIRMLGYGENEFYALTLADLLPETSRGRDLVFRYYNNRLAGFEAPSQYEAQMLTKRSEVIDVIISASRITVGGEVGAISIITDINRMKRAEDTIMMQFKEIQLQYEKLESLNRELLSAHNELLALNENLEREKERIAATLRSIGDAVISIDIEGMVVLMNTAAERLTGSTLEQSRAKNITQMLSLQDLKSGQDLAGLIVQIREGRGHELANLPIVMDASEGGERLVEVSGATITGGDGRPAGTVLAIRDITEKIKLEKELSKMSRIESLGVLAGGIAHDFNNLLTAIIGNLALAKLHIRDNPEFHDYIARIEQAAMRAANLTRQLLTFSKGGAPVKKTASIGELLRESAEFILAGSPVRCEFHFAADLWPVEIDTDQMSQVLNNILINAMQSMPRGGVIAVSAMNAPDTQGLPLARGRYVKISIQDQGAGIARKNLNKIFDPYFTTKEHGSGLGLASSYSIIKRHGGYIEVESDEGRGTTFHIYLHASRQDEMKYERKALSPERRTGRILVMDDENSVRDVAVNILSHFGYRVDGASEGGDAALKYGEAMRQGDPYKLVILDLMVPGGVGGLECLSRIREMDPAALAIVSSGYSSDQVMADYRSYGFNGIIMKPYVLQDVIKVLNEILGNGAAAAQG